MYTNNSALKVVQIRRAKVSDPKFMPKHDLSKLAPDQKKSVSQILANPKLAETMIKVAKPKVFKLQGMELYRALQEYVLKDEELVQHNYPIPLPKSKKIVSINDMSRFVPNLFSNKKRKFVSCSWWS